MLIPINYCNTASKSKISPMPFGYFSQNSVNFDFLFCFGSADNFLFLALFFTVFFIIVFVSNFAQKYKKKNQLRFTKMFNYSFYF